SHRWRQTRWPFTKAQPDCTAVVAVLPREPVTVVPARGADLIRMPFVPTAAAPRGPATTAPLGPAQPARTTPAAHSTACAVGMTPTSRSRTVATANSVGFITYLLASWGRLQVKIARPVAAPRERERVFRTKTSSVRQPSE